MAELYCETTSLLSKVDADLTSESLSVSSTGFLRAKSKKVKQKMLAHTREQDAEMKAFNEIKATLGWRVVCAWIGDDLCGDGDLPTMSHASYKVIIESFLNCCCNSVLGKSDPQTEPVVKKMFLIATARLKPDFEQQLIAVSRGRESLGECVEAWRCFMSLFCNFKEDLESQDHTNRMQSITMSHGGLLKLYLWCCEEFTTGHFGTRCCRHFSKLE
ncbi:hypothetical protein Tco_0724913 [Tanacetum coccineum]|uniref:Uncharacterized protein n=1 Tax=Tanacetum coccineum TaxID=301880 RepID=A0ABQ4YCB0_9ASTR